MFVLAFGEICRCVYQFVTNCLEETLLRGVNQGMPKQREEIVSHYDEVATGLGRPEVMGDETVDRKGGGGQVPVPILKISVLHTYSLILF